MIVLDIILLTICGMLSAYVLYVLLAFTWYNTGRPKFMGLICHDFMKWHKPSEESLRIFKGANICTKCKYCGKWIMRDNQGNWI